MDAEEFAALVNGNPTLQNAFASAQRELEPQTRAGGVELIAIGLLYPVVLYIFKRIGLPWLNAGVQLSDAQLAKFHAWLKQKYEPYGFDPKRMEAAADAIYTELSTIKSPVDQKLWESVRDRALASTRSDDV